MVQIYTSQTADDVTFAKGHGVVRCDARTSAHAQIRMHTCTHPPTNAYTHSHLHTCMNSLTHQGEQKHCTSSDGQKDAHEDPTTLYRLSFPPLHYALVTYLHPTSSLPSPATPPPPPLPPLPPPPLAPLLPLPSPLRGSQSPARLTAHAFLHAIHPSVHPARREQHPLPRLGSFILPSPEMSLTEPASRIHWLLRVSTLLQQPTHKHLFPSGFQTLTREAERPLPAARLPRIAPLCSHQPPYPARSSSGTAATLITRTSLATCPLWPHSKHLGPIMSSCMRGSIPPPPMNRGGPPIPLPMPRELLGHSRAQ